MSRTRGINGFSLLEVLAALVVLSVAAMAVTAVWRLADQKALRARLDHRAARLLREYAELQQFAPGAGQLTTDATGYLYHPRKIGRPGAAVEYDNVAPYTIATNAGQITISYRLPGLEPNQGGAIQQTVTAPGASPSGQEP